MTRDFREQLVNLGAFFRREAIAGVQRLAHLHWSELVPAHLLVGVSPAHDERSVAREQVEQEDRFQHVAQDERAVSVSLMLAANALNVRIPSTTATFRSSSLELKLAQHVRHVHRGFGHGEM
jgi:hypothetical protein